MKRISFFLIILLGLAGIILSCSKDPGQKDKTPEATVNHFSDLHVPSGFRFDTYTPVDLYFTVENPGAAVHAYKIKVYDASPYAGGNLIYSGVTRQGQLNAQLMIPQALKSLYLVKEDPSGSSSMAVKQLNGNTVNHTFGKGKKQRKTTVVSPDCNTGCLQNVNGGGYFNINNPGVYCITGNLNGLNDNNGNALIRICGNINVSGYFSIKGNTELEIPDGSSLTIQGINMNDQGGVKGKITVYTTGSLTIGGNFSAHGEVVNHGTVTLSSEAYLYGAITNNGTFQVNGTNYSTLDQNGQGPITNNGTMIFNGNLTQNSNSTLINHCFFQVKKQFQINHLVQNYSYIQVDGNFRSNSNSVLNYYDGAMTFIKGNAQGPLNGDMAGIGTTSLLKVSGGISNNSGADFTGNLELCIGGLNSLNNGSVVAPAMLQCDGVYIPTSPCNPQGNGSPTIVDSDNDGVADANDLFPNDPQRAGETFYPGSNAYGTLAFEDLWPAKGDYDFNDVVVDYRYRLITDASNHVKDVQIDYALRAIGGTFRNGFGLQLEVGPSSVESVTRSGSFVSTDLSANGTESGQSKAVILIFENAFDVLRNNGTKTVNTDPAEPASSVDTNRIVITFTTARAPVELGSFPYNPFIYTDRDRTREIHLSGKAPTDKANPAYFGQVDDRSDVGSARYYVTATNLPWGINLAQQFSYPAEKEDIVQAYLRFAEWAQSGGGSFADWYMDQAGYRNGVKIYGK